MPPGDLKPLFDTILNYIPAPEADIEQPFQMLVSSIDYNEFVGRIAVGRIERGTIKQNQEIVVCNYHDAEAAPKKAKAVSIYEFDGLAKKPVTESSAGNIIAMSGIGDITIGDTICAAAAPDPLPFVKISAPQPLHIPCGYASRGLPSSPDARRARSCTGQARCRWPRPPSPPGSGSPHRPSARPPR